MALERRQVRGAREPLRLVVEADAPGRGGQQLGERPRGCSERAEALREQVGDVGVVAAEELVAALAGERDLHVLGGELRDEVRRQRRRVGERLVERLCERRQEQRRVRLQRQLAVDRPVALRDGAGAGELVERRLLEADRERAHRLRRLLGGERGERARVDAAGEQHADGNVGDQMRAHGVAQAGAALLDELGLVLAVPGRERARAREARDRHLAVVPGQRVAGRELLDVDEDRERRRHAVEREERVQRVEADVAVLQRVELRGEAELAAVQPVGERLDPEAVAREHEPAPRRVPDGDREHAAQALPEPVAPLLVAVDEHLGVGARAERVARRLELAHQLAVVVDLAVLDDDDRAVLVRDRLVAAVEVDDREPPCGDSDSLADVHALRVGAAVIERGRHRAEPVRIDSPARARDPADPAHDGLG